jgi:membrane protease YdiL (CAAX protease family)
MDVTSKQAYPTITQGLGIVGILILGMILLSPIIFLGNQIGKSLSVLIHYLFSIGLPLGVVFFIRKKKTAIEHFNFKPFNPIIVPLVVIVTIAIALGVSIPIISLIPIPEFVKQAFLSMSDDHGVYPFITLVIAAPILEELIFRGIILDGFLKIYSPSKSIILSSILFGLVHLNPWQFLSGLFIGVFMGWIYYRTNSLWLTIIIHASLNLFSFVSTLVMDTTAADMDKSAVESYGGLTSFLIIVISSWIAIIVSVNYLNRYFDRQDNAFAYVQNDSQPSGE